MRKTIIGVALSAIAVTAAFAQSASTAQAQDLPTRIPVQDFDVFVDLPTGYTFVKLPAGWKFVGKVEQEQLANLPSTVHTSLLSHSSDDDIEVARSELAAAK
jgi:hypothetical protein